MATHVIKIPTILKEKTIQGTYAPKAWLSILNTLSLIIQKQAAKRKRAEFWAYVFGVFVFLGGVIWFTAWWDEDGTWPVGLSFVTIGLLGLVPNRILMAQQRQKELSHHVPLSTTPILLAMQKAFQPGTQVLLEVDARNPLAQSLKTDSDTNVEGELPYSITDDYTYPWMKGKGTLQQGVAIEWGCTSFIRHISRFQERNRERGGIKFKQKYKLKHRALLKLHFPKSQFHPKAELPTSFQLSEKPDSWEVKVEVEELFEHETSEESIETAFATHWMDPKRFYEALHVAYQGVNASAPIPRSIIAQMESDFLV